MKKLMLIVGVLIVGCGDDSATSSTTSCGVAYVGDWTLTDSGKYDNADCTGAKVPNTLITTQTLNLAEDCTQSVSDSYFCSDNSSENYTSLCTGTWYSSATTISIPAFGGAYVVDYVLNEAGTEMTTSQVVTVGTGVDGGTEEQCQYSTYTKSS